MNQSQQFTELLLNLTNDLATSSTLDEALERLVEITTTTIKVRILSNDTIKGHPEVNARRSAA